MTEKEIKSKRVLVKKMLSELEDKDDFVYNYTLSTFLIKCYNKGYAALNEKYDNVYVKFPFISDDTFTIAGNAEGIFNNCKGGIDKRKFDLYIESMNCAMTFIDKQTIDKEDVDNIIEIYQMHFMILFRIWFEKVKPQDIIDFFESEGPVKPIYDARHVSIQFEWGVDQGFPCSNPFALLDGAKTGGITKKEMKSAEKSIEQMKKAFDMMSHFMDDMTEEFNPGHSFIDDNIETCRELYLMAQLMFAMMPNAYKITLKEFKENSKRRESMFNAVTELLRKELSTELTKPEKKGQYMKVFNFCMLCTIVSEYKNQSVFETGHDNLFKSAIKAQSKYYKK